MRPNNLETLLARTERVTESGCWLWTGPLDRAGYGTVWFRGKATKSHRAVYICTTGTDPVGLDLDHVCRVRCCVNPFHLDPVTHAENMRRSPLIRAWNEKRKAAPLCSRGHVRADVGQAKASRWCKECAREAVRRYRGKRVAMRIQEAI